MFALVPTLRGLLQGFVVTLFVFLDEPLQADKATYFITQVVALQEEQESRGSAIAIAKWVDAQKVQIKSSQDNDGMDHFLFKAVIPIRD